MTKKQIQAKKDFYKTRSLVALKEIRRLLLIDAEYYRAELKSANTSIRLIHSELAERVGLINGKG